MEDIGRRQRRRRRKKEEVNLNVSHLINIEFFHDECCILLCLLFQFGELVGRCTQHNDLQRKRKITQVYSLRISSRRLKTCIAIRQRRRRRRRSMMTRGKPKDKAQRSSPWSSRMWRTLRCSKRKAAFVRTYLFHFFPCYASISILVTTATQIGYIQSRANVVNTLSSKNFHPCSKTGRLLVEVGGRRDKEIIMEKKTCLIVHRSSSFRDFVCACVCVFLLVNQNIDAQ